LDGNLKLLLEGRRREVRCLEGGLRHEEQSRIAVLEVLLLGLGLMGQGWLRESGIELLLDSGGMLLSVLKGLHSSSDVDVDVDIAAVTLFCLEDDR
jgi:hypothetical protein